MKVGFLGVQCGNPNLGVAALAHSVVGIVSGLIPGEAEFVLFSADSSESLERMAATMKLDNKQLLGAPIRHRPRELWMTLRLMKSCDVLIDLTGGDSFSDIYGLRRLIVKLTDKQLALLSGNPLVIAPQTIGPFRSRLILPWVSHILNRATCVFTRDEPSRQAVGRLTHREVAVATDVAVALPYDRSRYRLPPTSALRVGLNVSGLLWNGGYTGNNQFGLRTDYQLYCNQLVERLLADGFEVHLVPHVLLHDKMLHEDDVTACENLRSTHPQCQLAPRFEGPVDAKSYISELDVLIGSRMHATIAAFTSGVATVPVAYSRKFVGYYSNLGYHDLVDLTELDTATAVNRTVRLTHDHERLRDAAAAGAEIAADKLQPFVRRLSGLL